MEPVTVAVAAGIATVGCILVNWALGITGENKRLRESLEASQSTLNDVVKDEMTEEERLTAALPEKIHKGVVTGVICNCTKHKRYLVADDLNCYAYTDIKQIELEFN